MSTKFPIVLDRWELCTGKCAHKTWHRAVIYREEEFHTCNECGHKKEFGFGEEHKGITDEDFYKELEGLKNFLDQLATDITIHRWGKILGKKDKDFVDRILEQIIAKSKSIGNR